MEPTLPTYQMTQRSLARLMPRLEAVLAGSIALDPQGWKDFSRRLEIHFPALFKLYLDLYGSQYDFFFHLEDLLITLGRAWFQRPRDLRQLDLDSYKQVVLTEPIDIGSFVRVKIIDAKETYLVGKLI